MGNTITPVTFLSFRTIDKDDGVFVGIGGDNDIGNPMSKQKLYIRNDSYNKLKFFTKTDTNLIYEFENNITLQFYKNIDGIYYNLKYPKKNINKTKLIDLTIIEYFTKIELCSNELDQIYYFIKPTENLTNQ